MIFYKNPAYFKLFYKNYTFTGLQIVKDVHKYLATFFFQSSLPESDIFFLIVLKLQNYKVNCDTKPVMRTIA